MREATVRFATPGIILFLCALSLAFWWQVVVLHQVFAPINALYAQDPLWQPASTPSFSLVNTADMDLLTQFYPWTAIAARTLHQGAIPLWNPYAFAGTPLLGSMQPAVLYPVNLLLEWLASPTDVLGLRAMVHMALTLVGTFLFARSLGMSRAAALLAAVSFGLSLAYVGWLGWAKSGSLAWLPWMLLCAERIMTTRGAMRWIVAGALTVALEILTGHGETTAHVMLLGAAYLLWRASGAWRRETDWGAVSRALLAAGLALGLGIAMAAAHLFPVLEQFSLSFTAAARTTAPPVPLLGGSGSSWQTLVLALVPDFFGRPTPLVGSRYGPTANLYIGAVPLLLAILGVLRRRDAPTLFFAAAALITLGVALPLPVLGLLNNVPLLSIINNGNLRNEYAFAAAILAGYGLDTLRRHDERAGLPWAVACLWWLAVAAVALSRAASLLHKGLPPTTALDVAVPLVWLGVFVALLVAYRRGAVSPTALCGGGCGADDPRAVCARRWVPHDSLSGAGGDDPAGYPGRATGSLSLSCRGPRRCAAAIARWTLWSPGCSWLRSRPRQRLRAVFPGHLRRNARLVIGSAPHCSQPVGDPRARPHERQVHLRRLRCPAHGASVPADLPGQRVRLPQCHRAASGIPGPRRGMGHPGAGGRPAWPGPRGATLDGTARSRVAR